MMPDYFKQVVCLECQHTMPADISLIVCPQCGSHWLDARYDYKAVAQQWPQAVTGREWDLWRYHELLPVTADPAKVSMLEGATPLIRLYQYESLFEHEHLYIKDERQGPTSSFKDRQAALAVVGMQQAGISECAMASAGNAGVAYAAYCARAGIKLWLFVSSLVPSEKMREAALYGAEVIKVSGTYDEAKKVAAEFASRKNIHLDRGAKAIPSKESMKTLAYEIAEQLARYLPQDEAGKWVTPDWYIQAVSGGLGPLGVWKGFGELLNMGLIDRMPKLGIIQSAGCAPMVKAFEAGLEAAEAVVPRTLVTVLSTGNPGFSYPQLHQAVRSNGGTMLAIEDGEAFDAMRKLARHGGFSVEPAAAVAFAGLEKMLRNGSIAAGESVVINCSGHTLPVESFILGDRYVLDLDLETDPESSTLEEGLGAALSQLKEQITTVVIVDDNPTDRRLLRRVLQRYKNYRIYEARNGAEALTLVRDHAPDMVMTDLMMPGTDGFTLLENLKSDPKTAEIPVTVVSAKTLSPADRRALEAHSASVWMKGNFETRHLVDHVVQTLGDSPLDIIRNKPSTDNAEAKPHPEAKGIPVDDETWLVVVIDDNPRDLRLARRLIETSGNYRVLEATSGRDGLKMAYEYHPDLIVLDLMMPDIDGFEILEKLQGDDALREIPVIIYSGKDLTQEEQNRVREHIQSIIVKSSINRQQFMSKIKESLL